MDVLYADSDLIAVNKPAGLVTTPDDQNIDAVITRLRSQFAELYAVHRLDKDTTGVVLFARNRDAHAVLNSQFEARIVIKTYHMVIAGRPWWRAQTIDAALRDDADQKHRTLADNRAGKPARTTFSVVSQFEHFALIEAVPHSGRTHQIRAHLAIMGANIVEDRLYAELVRVTQPSTSIRRMALHALTISFNHPSTGVKTNITAPYAADFAALLVGR